MARHPGELWTPVRYVSRNQVCDFCWCTIPKGSPGNSAGTRGTRAWFNHYLGIWECLECRTEAVRAELMREQLILLAPRTVVAA